MDRCKVSYCIILPFMESQITKLAKFYRKHHHCLIYGSMAIWAVKLLRKGYKISLILVKEVILFCDISVELPKIGHHCNE